MTIAAGFVCMEGIVLGADSEEVIPGYTKNRTEKIKQLGIDDPELTIAMTGAGDSELIEKNYEIIIEAARSVEPQMATVYSVLQAAQRDFFQTFILPFAAYPDNERPTVDLLIAIRAGNQQRLFKAYRNTIREVEWNVDCLGMGLIMARSLVERLYDPFCHLDEAVLTAIYIIMLVKDYVPDCGGQTDLFVMARDRKKYSGMVTGSKIEPVESLFKHFDAINRSTLVEFANSNLSEREFEKSLTAAKKMMLKCRKETTSWNKLLLHHMNSWKKTKRR